MKRITIDLTEPFEEIEEKLSSIPPTEFIDTHEKGEFKLDPEVSEVLRRIYEAARGRHVATGIGLIPIAPPLSASLADAPFHVGTQADFLLQALARLGYGARAGTGIRARELEIETSKWKCRTSGELPCRPPVGSDFRMQPDNYDQPIHPHHHSSS